MEIKSVVLGAVEALDQDIYALPQGLYGLEDYRKYALIRPDESLPFVYLQAVEEAGVCLLLVNPFLFYPDYEFDLSEQDMTQLGQPSPEEIAVFVTVSGAETIRDATINLLAPVVLNVSKRTGRQVVLHNTKYQTKTPMFLEHKEG